MQRRLLLIAAGALPFAQLAHAHHGWSSFDQDHPIFLEGKARKVKRQNPHTELMLEVTAGLKLPADLATRTLPAQAAPVDGKALLAKAVLPKRSDAQWEVELAPLTRMQAWNVPEIKDGSTLSLLGFTFKDEKGGAIVRVEYLWFNSQTYALRSGPA